MATAAWPVRSTRVAGDRLRALGRAARRFWSRVTAPARPALGNLAKIPLTFAGLGCISAGFFALSTVAGLFAAGVTLILLEHMIADEP